MIIIEHLTKKYGEKKAVDDLSLEINDGEIYGFIGRNGAGKTTTIKCISGILSFDSGNIFINGSSILEDPMECKKQLAYIPDNPSLYEYMTGREFISFISNIFTVDIKEKERKTKEYAERFELEKNLDDKISSYSHGMKQKLVLVSALVHSPRLFLLDEPFVGLDPKASFELKKIMKEMCDSGATIFYSTHVLEVAEKLCDKVAIIKDGKLVKSGTMEEITKDESLEEVFLSEDNDE